MPYCWKCGAPIDEDAKFCPKCGTASAGKAEGGRTRTERRPVRLPAAILIAIISIAAVAVASFAITLLPYKTVGPVSIQELVPYRPDVSSLYFNLTAEVAMVNITFKNLKAEPQMPLVVLNASASAKTGAFGTQDFLLQYMPTWQIEVNGNLLTVTVEQEVDRISWPWHSSLNVTFDVLIDLSMRTNLSVKTGIGGVAVKNLGRVFLNSAIVETSTGGVEVDLNKNTVILGDISIKVKTGGARLTWDNATVNGNIQISLETVTGGVDLAVTQRDSLLGNVMLKAKAKTGGITLSMEIKGNVGATIESEVNTGGINVVRQIGFSGTETFLQSNNYPAGRNFNTTLQTTTGGISLDAKYTP